MMTRETFDPEIGLLQSAAVWYLLAIRFEARLGEYLLQSCEYVLVCACRGACMLRAGVEVVSEFVEAKRLHVHVWCWSLLRCVMGIPICV